MSSDDKYRSDEEHTHGSSYDKNTDRGSVKGDDSPSKLDSDKVKQDRLAAYRTSGSLSAKLNLGDKDRKKWAVIAAIAVSAALLFTLGYKIGHDKGFDAGVKDAKKSQSNSPLQDMFNNQSNPFKNISGKVRSISEDSIEVDSSKGQRETVKITTTTRITKKGEDINISDVNKDQKVTVFVSGQDDDKSATRIVVLD